MLEDIAAPHQPQLPVEEKHNVSYIDNNITFITLSKKEKKTIKNNKHTHHTAQELRKHMSVIDLSSCVGSIREKHDHNGGK